MRTNLTPLDPVFKYRFFDRLNRPLSIHDSQIASVTSFWSIYIFLGVAKLSLFVVSANTITLLLFHVLFAWEKVTSTRRLFATFWDSVTWSEIQVVYYSESGAKKRVINDQPDIGQYTEDWTKTLHSHFASTFSDSANWL